jgi:hypothetical protein
MENELETKGKCEVIRTYDKKIKHTKSRVQVIFKVSGLYISEEEGTIRAPGISEVSLK